MVDLALNECFRSREASVGQFEVRFKRKISSSASSAWPITRAIVAQEVSPQVNLAALASWKARNLDEPSPRLPSIKSDDGRAGMVRGSNPSMARSAISLV